MERTCLIVIVAILLICLASCSSDIQQDVPEIVLTDMEPQVVAKINQLRDKVKNNPDDADAWGRLGMNLYAHELMPEAAVCFRQASKLNSKEYRWPYYTAISLHNIGLDESLDWYQKAIKLKPDNAQLHVRMGNAYLAENNDEDAAQHFRKAIELDSRRADAYVGLAQIDYNLNNYAEATELLEKAISIEPNLRQAHALLISCYRMQWEQDKVMEASKRLSQLTMESTSGDPILNEIAQEGVSYQWCMERGADYMKQQQLNAAADEFRRAIELRPQSSAYSQLAIVLINQNKPEEAITNFRKAQELTPKSGLFNFNLGIALCDNGYESEGIKYLEQASQLMPDETRYSAALFDQYIRFGRWADAVTFGSKIYDAYPKNQNMGLDLAWILSTCPLDEFRNGSKAVQIAEPIAQRMNRDPEALDCLAAAYAETRQFSLAIKTISKAIQLAQSANDQQKVNTFREREEQYQRNLPWRSETGFRY